MKLKDGTGNMGDKMKKKEARKKNKPGSETTKKE